MKNHKKQHQAARFAFMSEFFSNIEKNHSFYAKRVKRFRNDPAAKNLFKGARQWIEVEVELMRVCYEDTGNPIFLWRAFANCVDGELSFPQWIIDYFYDSAKKIVDSAYVYEQGREKDLLSEALNFKSSGNKNNFSEWKKIFSQLKMVNEVMKVKMASDLSYEKIEAQVAADLEPDNEQEQAKIERNLKRWRQVLKKIPENLDSV
jgi:hypothetical protein